MKRESESYRCRGKKATEDEIDSFFANLLCTPATDTAALLESVTEDLMGLLLPALVTVWDHNATAGCLVLQDSNPPRLGSNSTHTIPTNTSMTGLAVHTSQAVLFPSLEETIDGRQFENPEVRAKLGLQWMYCIPVLARDRSGVAAVINLYYCKGEPTPPLTEAQCRRLSSILGLLISLTVFHEQAAIRSAVNRAAVVATGVSGLIREVYSEISERCHCTALDLYLLNQADGRVEKELELSGDINTKLLSYELEEGTDAPDVSPFFSACIERGKSLAIAEQVKADDSSKRTATQCMAIGAPLITRTGRPFGILRCFSPDSSRRFRPSFSSLDLLRLETFLQSLSPAIERFTRTRAEQTLLKAFSELTRSSGKRVAISGFLEEALGALVGSMHAEVGSIYLRETGSDVLRMKAAYGPGKKLVGKAEYRVGEGVTGWIAESGEMVVLNSKGELESHHAYQGRYDEEIWGQEGTFRNFIGVPIESSEKRVGVLKISNRGSTSHHPEDYFTDEDREHLAIFSSFIGYGLERERMLSGFRTLAETSVESLTAEDEDDAISTILAGLEDVGFRHVALELCRAGSVQLKRYIGTGVWEEEASAGNSRAAENPWQDALKSGNYAVLSADGLQLSEDVGSVIIVPLISQVEKLGTITVGAEDELPLEPSAILLVRAFGAHLAVAIAAARHRRKLLEHTEAVMASSRFIVAEALSGFALHSLHHKVSELLERLETRLRDPRIREREEVRTALEDVRNELTEFEISAEGILDIVRSPEDQDGSVDVNAALQKVLDQWYSLIMSKRSRVEVLREATHSRADIPQYAFHEIMSVLIVNAIQAHSSVIRIRSWDSPEITLQDGTTVTDVICIDVKDNGQGVAIEPRDRIFDADFTTKPRKFGTGLGLFIARRLANESGGELYVLEKGRQAKGTTFRLVLQQGEEEEDGRSD